MAEGRMLKRRISSSKKYASLKNWRARELYLLMLPQVDAAGRLEADPQLIKGQIVPLLSYNTEQIQRALEQLHDAGLIILYEADDDQCLEYTQFHKFNKIRSDRESKSEIPPPLQEGDGSTPPQVKLSLNEDKLSSSEVKLNPTEQQCIDMGFKLGLTDEQSSTFFHHYNKKSWVDGASVPLTDLQSSMIGWRNNSYKFAETETKKKTVEEILAKGS